MKRDESLRLLTVTAEDGRAIQLGKARQVSRNFPPDVGIGDAVAIHAGAPLWQIVAVGRLVGAGYYPGGCKDPAVALGKAVKRSKAQPGAWVWALEQVTAIPGIPFARQAEARGSVCAGDRIWSWTDSGSGDWWSCCVRELDDATVRRVREAYRKARATK